MKKIRKNAEDMSLPFLLKYVKNGPYGLLVRQPWAAKVMKKWLDGIALLQAIWHIRHVE